MFIFGPKKIVIAALVLLASISSLLARELSEGTHDNVLSEVNYTEKITSSLLTEIPSVKKSLPLVTKASNGKTVTSVVSPLISENLEKEVKPLFGKICVLGDSLSDCGRLYRMFLGAVPGSPPYRKGRFSNGPTWAEHAADYFEELYGIKTINMAVGGATAYERSVLHGNLPFTVNQQRDHYLCMNPFNSLLKRHCKTLFIIWIGANDYLDGVTKGSTVTKMVSETIVAIGRCIDVLRSYGAKHFMVLNMPDLTKTPSACDPKTTEERRNELARLTSEHNNELKKLVEDYQNYSSGMNIHLHDVYKVMADAFADPDKFNDLYGTNITILDKPYHTGGYFRKIVTNDDDNSRQLQDIRDSIKIDIHSKNIRNNDANEVSEELIANTISDSPTLRASFYVSQNCKDGINAIKKDASKYFYFDKVHPSAVVHKVFGMLAISFIKAYYTVVSS